MLSSFCRQMTQKEFVNKLQKPNNNFYSSHDAHANK